MGITRKLSFEADDFSPVFGHMFASFYSTCLTVNSEPNNGFCPSGGWNLHLIAYPKVCLWLTSVYLCAHAHSLEVSLMVLRYICLFSARPVINDPAKLRSHPSQTALIPLLIPDQLDLHLPPYETGRRRNELRYTTKQPNSRRRGRDAEGRNGGPE